MNRPYPTEDPEEEIEIFEENDYEEFSSLPNWYEENGNQHGNKKDC